MLLAAVGVMVAGWFGRANTATPVPNASITPTPIPRQILTWNKIQLEYYLGLTRKNPSVVVNLNSQVSGIEIDEFHNCSGAINGGFYDEAKKPVGWLVSGEEKWGRAKDSLLLDGFVFETDGQTKMQRDVPLTPVEWGFQSGPILWQNGRQISLSMANDKTARRMILGKTKSGEMMLLSVFNPTVLLDGVYLGDLPQILGDIFKKEGVEVDWAVNLDGGSASYYSFGDKVLHEINPVGSVVCFGQEG